MQVSEQHARRSAGRGKTLFVQKERLFWASLSQASILRDSMGRGREIVLCREFHGDSLPVGAVVDVVIGFWACSEEPF